MRNLIKNRIFLTFLGLALILLYIPINRLWTGGYNTHLPIDDYFQIIPIFVLPYLLGTILFLVLPIIMMKFAEDKIFYPFILTIIIAAAASDLINIFIPTYVVREKIIPTDFYSDLIRLVYANDNINNAAPSGHTFFSIINLYFFSILLPKYRVSFFFIVLLIVLSTLFTGQHNIFDLISGLIFGALSIILGLSLYKVLHSRFSSVK